MEHAAVLHAVESGSKIQDLAWMILIAPLVMAVGTTLFVPRDRTLAAVFNI